MLRSAWYAAVDWVLDRVQRRQVGRNGAEFELDGRLQPLSELIQLVDRDVGQWYRTVQRGHHGFCSIVPASVIRMDVASCQFPPCTVNVQLVYGDGIRYAGASANCQLVIKLGGGPG